MPASQPSAASLAVRAILSSDDTNFRSPAVSALRMCVLEASTSGIILCNTVSNAWWAWLRVSAVPEGCKATVARSSKRPFSAACGKGPSVRCMVWTSIAAKPARNSRRVCGFRATSSSARRGRSASRCARAHWPRGSVTARLGRDPSARWKKIADMNKLKVLVTAFVSTAAHERRLASQSCSLAARRAPRSVSADELCAPQALGVLVPSPHSRRKTKGSWSSKHIVKVPSSDGARHLHEEAPNMFCSSARTAYLSLAEALPKPSQASRRRTATPIKKGGLL
mmetsp:Transcript_26799/g.76722  ORF Transcript_26799/g.76722 Transcript_26799/m.76722 type:complete len:281 (+) Transcript_26799:249-1091(+)